MGSEGLQNLSGIPQTFTGIPFAICDFEKPYEFPIETLYRSRIDPLFGALVENPYGFIIQALQRPIVEPYGSSLYILIFLIETLYIHYKETR